MLETIFYNGWTFIGTLILIFSLSMGITEIIKALLSPWKKDVHFHIEKVQDVDIDAFIDFMREKNGGSR